MYNTLERFTNILGLASYHTHFFEGFKKKIAMTLTSQHHKMERSMEK